MRRKRKSVTVLSFINVLTDYIKSSVTAVKRTLMTVKQNAQQTALVLSFINVPMVKMRSRATHVKRMMTVKPNAQLKMMVLLAKRELSGARMDQVVHAMQVQKAARTTALSVTSKTTMFNV